MDSATVKKVSKQLNHHLKTLNHQPISLTLNRDNDDVELIINSDESRLRIDFYAQEVEKKEKLVFSENDLQQLQSKIHKITGDGEVMGIFNELLGINEKVHVFGCD